MNDLQTQIEEALRGAVVRVLGGDYADADPLIVPAKDPKFGDYQANLAMGLAKKVGRKPRDLAEAIVAELSIGEMFASAEVAGPGFINLKLTGAALDGAIAAMAGDGRLGVSAADPPRRVVIDYSSPNVAKEMHVGHLRSTIIGDAIARVLTHLGQDVVRQNHLGDWGTQFGMLIEYLAESGADRSERGIADLNAFYQQSKKKFDEDADFADRARKRVVALQGGDDQTVALWRSLYDESLKHFAEAYERLGVSLTEEDVRGESAYNDMLPGVVEALAETGQLRESQGAAVVYPEGFTDREGEPMPMIVRKSDGGYLYATTDLAAARFRIEELHADRVVYVTDSRQAQHFAMVFQTLRQTGWAPDRVRLDYVAFGTILGPDRKPFKTRSGGTVKLADVLDEAVQRAAAVIAEKNPDMPEDERQQIAEVVGIGAVKYGDLSNDRIKDYVFDWDRMLALEGNTSPYLQNAYVRVRAIFRKASEQNVAAEAIHAQQPQERVLARHLLQWPRVILSVADSLEPHRLCNYLYELAQYYHRFYEHCPVLKAEDHATRASRLALCELVGRTLKQGLDLLGIGVVERM